MPHFGVMWEHKSHSVKGALHSIIGSQILIDKVLRTLLIDVEAILNAKPLLYVSPDVADSDPVTPNYLLIGQPDELLQWVVYTELEIHSLRRYFFIKNYLPTLQPHQKWMSD